MTLTLADATRVIAGAIEKVNRQGIRMNIAVCDAGGQLLAFQRMDGAMWVGVCGVGGGTAQEDEDCARAGVEKL